MYTSIFDELMPVTVKSTLKFKLRHDLTVKSPTFHKKKTNLSC